MWEQHKTRPAQSAYRLRRKDTDNVQRFDHLFVGIDVGTGGVRALAATEIGRVVARTAVAFDPTMPLRGADVHEQQADAWWQAACAAGSTLMAELEAGGIPAGALTALSVDGTSGTLVCVDAAGNPVRPGIMYNDSRAGAEAEGLNELAGDFCRQMGYRFKASFALAKIAWVRRHEPEHFEKTARLIHQADYILGNLTGEFGVSDYSNALKTGYDLINDRWPAWLARVEGVMDRLPRVVAPGTQVGVVSPAAAAQTGLPRGLPVLTGATDGTAACLASGVKRPGDANTTLGTTLVFKGVSRKLCSHPEGLVYSHKLPGGLWLPGAAGNTGCEWIETFFPDEDPARMDSAAAERLPNEHIAYPLVRKGERFPFLSDTASGFFLTEPADKTDRYAACLQGIGFVERLAYEVLDEVMGTGGEEVFSTGGGSCSDVWMQCRADVTGRTMHRPDCPESAFGSAVLAAAGTVYADLWQAVRRMVRIERSFHPRAGAGEAYNSLYRRFCIEMGKRGYIANRDP